MQEIIDKYFKDGSILYYRPSDLIAADHYIRYEWYYGTVLISVGSDHGEVPLFTCKQADELEQKIKLIIT